MAKRLKYVRPTFTYGPIRRGFYHNRFQLIPPWDPYDPENWPKIRSTRREILGMLLFWIIMGLFLSFIVVMILFFGNTRPANSEPSLLGLAASLVLANTFPILGIRKAIYDLRIVSKQEQQDQDP